MNLDHDKLCGSPEWAEYLQSEILPPATTGIDLGQHLLEIGPGPGAATTWLSQRVARLTALEADPLAASRLAAGDFGARVGVDTGDAAQMPYDGESFDSVASFTMLHHVPTAATQYRILAEVLRVLRPGGTLVGSDSLASTDLHHFHEGDTYNPVEPATLLTWLRALGFWPVAVTVGDVLTFTARKPGPAADGACTAERGDDREVTAS
jgi:ubiquinone/menaquinone biosynthesis C-methylase UbiE